MKDDGARLTFSIKGKYVTINNNLTSDMFMVTPTNGILVSTLDKGIVYNHIQNIQSLCMQMKMHTFGYRPFGKFAADNSVKIIECDHYSYRLIVNGKCAELSEVGFKGQRGFDTTKLLEALNFAYSKILSDDASLKPSRDIVRRIADVGILVWVYDGHTVVCKDSNISGVIMLNCLVDDKYYSNIYVSISEENNECVLFNKNLEEILTFPLDKSILTYFSDDAKGFT